MKPSLKASKNRGKNFRGFCGKNYPCFISSQKISIEVYWGTFIRQKLRHQEQSRWRKNSSNRKVNGK